MNDQLLNELQIEDRVIDTLDALKSPHRVLAGLFELLQVSETFFLDLRDLVVVSGLADGQSALRVGGNFMTLGKGGKGGRGGE
jgi:hypothetical protein